MTLLCVVLILCALFMLDDCNEKQRKRDFKSNVFFGSIAFLILLIGIGLSIFVYLN